jgi:hypothetical protein
MGETYLFVTAGLMHVAGHLKTAVSYISNKMLMRKAKTEILPTFSLTC